MRIHRFLHEMKEPYKEVFSLRVFGELPFNKIAEILVVNSMKMFFLLKFGYNIIESK
ncbi:hypothetical protein [Miniphocaeibacter halophilus]|uniref:Uncharacterized protein n=1 Tax=Miniphocaeibacter halophilus TaxID=2931922 RepID=A0AC61MRU6_9FIRM|nr:hypothetical protein [Miniphocaeibacter halophilus]QQK08290.1 hypothetical protein JFY71_01750 [Miniphocaeibacter halophilus]